MGMKRRPKKTEQENPCGVARGELRNWEHCECYACTTKQMEVLQKQLDKAKKNEGIS